MIKGGPSGMIEATFKASAKGKEEHNESGHISEEEDEANIVKKLQRGSGRFRGKLPFKCFACGRVSHYDARCPHKDKYEKGKEYAKENIKQVVNKRSYYTMKIAMVYIIVMKMKLDKITDFSWLMMMIVFGML